MPSPQPVRFLPAFCLAVFTLLSLVIDPAAGAVSRVRKAAYVRGEALVCFRADVPEERVVAILQRHRTTLVKAFPDHHLYCVRLPARVTTRVGVRRFLRERDVAFCHPNFLYHAVNSRPNDPFFEYLWGLENTGQENGTGDADVDAPEAWDLAQGSEDVVVAVIDTGVDYDHPDLRANMWTNPGEVPGNGIDDDGNGYVDDLHGWNAQGNNGNPQDDNGHGTHVAGTIGAVGNNNLGVTGVAWRVSIVALKFLTAEGGGSTVDAIECLDYVHRLRDRGVNIIATNNSWGGVPVMDRALYEAVQRSHQRGILFVAAAGNEGRNNDVQPDFPSNFDLPNVISVAATDRNDRLADFSNVGAANVDLAAPGVEILSTVPRFVDPSLPYRFLSGTSMAAPHVTGAVVLLKSHIPSLGHLAIKERMLGTGDPLTSLQGRTVTGRRLNVHNALIGTAPTPVEGPELEVQVTARRVYLLGRGAAVRVRVTDPVTGAGVGNAAVRLVVQTATGDLYALERNTNRNGFAVFRFRTERRDGRGVYIATAGVTHPDYVRGSDYTTFLVL